MSERLVALSPEQVMAHNHEAVRVFAFAESKQGDGWVLNDPNNGHLSGKLLHLRANTNPTLRGHYELISADETLLQSKIVEEYELAEMDRVVGVGSEEGEIGKVHNARAALSDWVTLSQERIQWIKEVFSGVAERRTGAVNDHNREIGRRAVQLSTLKDSLGRDNPFAMMAMTHPLTQDMLERYDQVSNLVIAGNHRRQREHKWIMVDEAGILRQAQEFSDNFLKHPSYEMMSSLVMLAHKARFRVQPFNLLAHEFMAANVRSIDDVDPEMIRRFQVGLGLGRHVVYLLRPFQFASGFNFVAPKAISEVATDIDERLAALEEMPLTGEYCHLADRIQPLGEDIKKALKKKDPTGVSLPARQVTRLLVNYCDPKDDPKESVWYGSKMSHTRVLARPA